MMTRASAEPASIRRGAEHPGRRAKLRNSILLLLVTAVGLLGLITWRRDTHHVQQRMGELEIYRGVLQAEYERLGRFPAALPRVKRPTTWRRTYAYMDDATRYYLHNTDATVIVLSTPRVDRILGEDWRGVIVAEKGLLSVHSMNEDEFRQMWTAQEAAVANRSPSDSAAK